MRQKRVPEEPDEQWTPFENERYHREQVRGGYGTRAATESDFAFVQDADATGGQTGGMHSTSSREHRAPGATPAGVGPGATAPSRRPDRPPRSSSRHRSTCSLKRTAY